MKSNKKIIYTLMLSYITLATNVFPIILSDNINEEILIPSLKTPNANYWSNFTYIHINNNWENLEGYNWLKGNGSYGNPYIIEDIVINASTSPTGSGIYIQNSQTAFFTIQNCTIVGAKSGLQDAGIKLENTRNGKIQKNNCSLNSRIGILLSSGA